MCFQRFINSSDVVYVESTYLRWLLSGIIIYCKMYCVTITACTVVGNYVSLVKLHGQVVFWFILLSGELDNISRSCFVLEVLCYEKCYKAVLILLNRVMA